MTDPKPIDPFNGRLERAVLESSTPAIDRELSMYYVETIRSTGTDRLIRVSHPTAMEEEVYVLVTAEVVSHDVARALMKGHPVVEVKASVPAEEEAGEGGHEVACAGGRKVTLVVGKRYRVEYRAPGGSIREAVITYLGIGFRGLSFDASLRSGPVFLLPVRIRSAEQVPDGTEHYVDKMVRSHQSTVRTSDQPLG